MRLQRYIMNEYDSYGLNMDRFFSLWQTLLKDCKPYLQEFQKTKSDIFLMRAVTGNRGNTIQKKYPKVDRIPVDTPIEVHDLLNMLFKKEFGWPVRNGVFAANEYFDGFEEYGKPFLFFPIGKYKFVWSPEIKDLWMDVIQWKTEYYRRPQDIANDEEKLALWNFDRINVFQEEVVNKYKSGDLKGAIKSGNEISFNCKSYYVVSNTLYPEIEQMLKLPLKKYKDEHTNKESMENYLKSRTGKV